ncbi:hypothetical protein M3591_06350 [Exiguobacterium sp. MER 193]|uniref:hypothetical protein n=1 Tax=Exiguobacterium TaxID=33986 RepID=UPI00203F10BE|nr:MULTISPECIES: hypothetical protein [Exiguobacterium]MCM3280154.1 hypothetical protein [Exiguobacterium sp. MER 193]
MKLTKGRILEFGFVLFMAIILITSIIEESWFDASVAGAGIISGLIPFFIEKTCELLATYLLHKLKWELLGKTMLLLATIVYQAHRAVPALNGCQSANINRLRLALMSRS